MPPLQRLARGALVASGLFLLAGGSGYEPVTRMGDCGAGAPVPERTLFAVPAPVAPLPPDSRLVGTTPRAEPTWVHGHSGHRITHRDAFTPLTAPDWHSGEPVVLLEEDRTVPGWMPDEMRRRGIAVTDDPALLVRRKLDGVVPGADAVVAGLCLAFGATFAVAALGIPFGYRYRRRGILRTLAATPAGDTRPTGRA